MTDSRSDPTIVQRLMQALEADTAVELARALGLPVADVEQALAKGQVPDEWVRICAAETGCNADWLFFGRGPMRLPLVESGAMPACLMLEDVDDDVDMITVPLVVARLSAGSGSLEVSSEQEGGYAFRSDFLHRKGNPRRMVLMRVSGDSMVPEIQDNDLVLLDQGQTEIVSGRLYAIGFEDAIYIKRIDLLPGQIVLHSTNPAYPPVTLDLSGDCAEQFRVIGRVLWSGREYRYPQTVSIHIFRGRGGLFPAEKSPPLPLSPSPFKNRCMIPVKLMSRTGQPRLSVPRCR